MVQQGTMIRRSRISVRPNVKPTGRGPATSRDASQDNPQAAQAPADLAHDSGVTTGGDEVRPAPSAPAAAPNNTAELQSDSIMTEPELSRPAG